MVNTSSVLKYDIVHFLVLQFTEIFKYRMQVVSVTVILLMGHCRTLPLLYQSW